MDFKTLLIVGMALVALQLCSAQPVKRSCACNLRGVDACSCIPVATIKPTRPRAPGSGQRVVYQKFAAPTFNPIGDVCTCSGGGLIQPAIVPSIPCKVHPRPCDGPAPTIVQDDCDGPSNPCEENNYESRVTTYTINAQDNQPSEELVEVPIRERSGPVAADAVSLAIAYDIASRQNKKIKEGILNFGPLQKPVDGFIKTKKTYVPEAGLHQLRSEVVELRAPTFGKTCEDDAEASLLAAQDSCGEEDTSYNGRLLTYNDLGFTAVKKPCNFVQGSYTPSAPVVETVEYVVPAARALPQAPGYSACDALGTIERGRGSSGYDGYENAQETPEEECGDSYDSDYAPAESSYPMPSMQSYGAPAPAPTCSRCRASTCSCNRGY